MSTLVAIYGVRGAFAGSGFVVGNDLVLTCSHVINIALGRSTDCTLRPTPAHEVMLRFGGAPREVRVGRLDSASDAWNAPPASRIAGADICLLKLAGGLPEGAKIAQLATIVFDCPLEVRVGGYPAEWNREPTRAEPDYAIATVLGEDGPLWLLRSDAAARYDALVTGQRSAGLVHRGFSGGPADVNGIVVGLVVEARAEVREATAYIILCEHFPLIVRPKTSFDKARRRDRVPGHSAHGNSRPFLVPPLPPHYTIRIADEQAVVAALQGGTEIGRSILAISAVHGLGGIGKTTLAAGVAHSPFVAAQFPDGVLWARLGTQPQILPQLSAWVLALGEEGAGMWTVESATAYLRSVLHDRSVLIVLDDVWDEQDLQYFLLGGPTCHVLATTRRAHIFDRHGAEIIDLGAMSREEARELLARRSLTRRRETATARPLNYDELAADLGDFEGHPLAIELIGALGARGYTSSDIKHQIQGYRRKHPRSGENDSTLSTQLESCITISFDILRRESEARWRTLLWLSLFSRQFPFTENQVSAALGMDLAQARQHLLSLADDSLVARDGERFRMHDLVRDKATRLLNCEPPEGIGVASTIGHQTVIANIKSGKSEWDWEDLTRRFELHDCLIWHLTEGGLKDDLFSLLTANEGNGRNAWYTLRRDTGKIAAYLAELDVVRGSVCDDGSQGIGRAVLVDLARSSVITLEEQIPEELFTMLVVQRIWTPLRAYLWASQHRNETLRPAMLVALVVGLEHIRSSSEDEEMENLQIKKMATSDAVDLLLRLKSSKILMQRMAYLINCTANAEKERLIEKMIDWCGDPEKLYVFICNVPLETRNDFAEFWSARLASLNVDRDTIYWLARIVPLLGDEYRATWSAEVVNKLEQLFSPLLCQLELAPSETLVQSSPPKPENSGATPRKVSAVSLLGRMFGLNRTK